MQEDLFGGYMPKKRCPYCGRVKDISEFNTSKSGVSSYCKACQKLYKKKHPSKEYKQHKADYHSEKLFK